uniref:Cytosolic fatty-acid binding proteins domain-containing protein n=1 Tax=Oncorhynchus kisutch TaxID=8019 RepID=A0A8C7FP33_ONCKI
MAFSGKYKLEGQENYYEFLEAIDIKVITEVLREGDDFTWSQVIPNWTWTSKFTIGSLKYSRSCHFKDPNSFCGKIAIPFPQYRFTAEISGEKLIMVRAKTTSKGLDPLA